MTQYLPGNLLALFAPRDPIPYLPPVDKLPYEKQTAGYSGISAFVHLFEDPAITPASVKYVSREERQEYKRKAKAEATAYKLEQDIALWSPSDNPLSTSDPYKTLFVARVNYNTSEAKLRREFEIYGQVKKVSIVHDKSGKPRGYAFIEYDRERDMHTAYKHADGKKIDGRRVLVDVERGRTVKGWLPRRLGGGLGGTRRGGPDVNVKHSGREETREDRYGGAGKDRVVERERERPERPERRRSRSRSRERRRRSRSRSRERHRGDRHKRDRSRDRARDRNAPPLDPEKLDGAPKSEIEGTPNPEAPRERRRRSRDRDHKRRRSRSRDRKRREYERGDRDHDRDRRKSDRGAEKPASDDNMVPDIKIKEEPMDPEPSQDGFNNEEYNEKYNEEYNQGDYTNNGDSYNDNEETNDNENEEGFNSFFE
ncbi:hypothetical protein JTE90_017895 [Oedothorax gibbosus]|uniref:U1 small nuclear ribonucleoprotein 70 kDa n=1 Tax=Oedothorax gibbosus TaxID=931172 RepID=A0AAV6VFX7_9ARAC|nr:hypothetical protein JTE90_017895 [Oedothorax gibbosus]